MDHWSNVPQDDFLEFKPTYPQTQVPSNNFVSTALTTNPEKSSYVESDTIEQLKIGFSKMVATMERLEQRLNRVEQTTSLILKNQQETLQVPFMSQSDLDKARQVAEQLEHDTNVAKQLQAAYNKETEVKKNTSGYAYPTITDCPVCGVKVASMELQAHVEQCLEMFSNDPKKQVQVQETKKKVDQGFFGRMLKFNSTSTKTETKVTTQHQATASPSDMNEGVTPVSPPYAYPNFGYPNMPYQHNQPGNTSAPQIMMPMYMYPSYPHTHMTTHLQE